jgi:hypothetical protein
MALEFVIIPLTDEYEKDAYVFENRLKSACYNSLNIEFDKNYEQSLSARVGKYRNMGKDLIIVDNNYDENDEINVRYSNSLSRSESMNTSDFIDSIVSLEGNDDEPEEKKREQDDNDKKEKDDDNYDGYCNIM